MFAHTLFVILPILQVVSAQQGFCNDYVVCMDQLEEKQRDCLVKEQNTRLRSRTTCSRQKWDLKLELNGLHLRRAEMAKDCVKRNMEDAKLSVTTLDKDRQLLCSALQSKFAFAPMAPSRKKRSSSKRSKRNSKAQTGVAACRTATKAWHKQCAALAECCPLTEDCKLDTKDIMQEIFTRRGKLRELKEQCGQF